jgi:hypothetical protein
MQGEVRSVLHALSQLIGRELRCRDDAPAGRVTGFLIDDRAWALRYVRVHLADDLPLAQRLLPCAALPPLARATPGPLAVCLTPSELARGLPPHGDDEPLTRKDEEALHDALHWQPYWHDAEAAPLHDAEAALGAALYCCGEPFGRIGELLVDTGGWTVPALRIDADAPGATGYLYLPTAFVTVGDWGGARFDSDIRAAALACAPASTRPVPGTDYLDRLRHHLASAHTTT